MAYSYVQKVAAGDDTSGNSLTTGAITVTAGNLVVVFWEHWHDNVSGKGTPTVTISDSQGGTWAQNVEIQTWGVAGVSDGSRIGCAYCLSATGGSTTVTFALGGGNNWTQRRVVAMEYAPGGSASFDTSISAKGTASPLVTGTFSTSGAGLVVVARTTYDFFSNWANWGAFTVDGSAYTNREDTTDRIQAGEVIPTGAITNGTVSSSNGNTALNVSTLTMAFSVGVGGGGGSTGTRYRRLRRVLP